MNIFKHSIKIIALAICTTFMSCNDRYPDLEDGLYAEIVTSMDTMVVKLYHEKAPVTVANFVALSQGTHPMVDSIFKGKKFYNGLIFHRVMNNFMIQGGDPESSGRGGPGYKFNDEFDETLRHDKPGILSMANGGPNLNGSQFFITEVPTPWLDGFDAEGNLKNCEDPRIGCHSVFGEVVLGLNVQDSISNVKLGPGNRPENDVIILDVNIIRKGFDAKNFDAVNIWETELPRLEEKAKLKAEAAQLKAEDAAKAAKAKAETSKAAFIEENKNLKGRVKNLPTGLVMIYTHEANGTTPKATENVLVNYAGYFENGDLFDTSWKDIAKKHNTYNEQRDQQNGYQPFSMIYNEKANLVPGFREAMLNMNVGDKARVFIPSYLGYGASGRPGIPANSNLIFDLEIVGIDK